MTTLSAVIITRHNMKAIATKKSVSFADEILVEEHDEIINFAKVRNKALKKAKSEWVLFVDDDEIITLALRREIKTAILLEEYDGYYLRRVDNFLGRTLKHGETADITLLRLARRSSGQFHRPVHEVWYVEGKTSKLKNPLIHNPHSTISSFLTKINKYSTIEAQYRNEAGRKSSMFKIFTYPIGKFLRNYFILLGFLDGTPGLIMAVMMSFHSFQTWTKLYLLQNKN